MKDRILYFMSHEEIADYTSQLGTLQASPMRLCQCGVSASSIFYLAPRCASGRDFSDAATSNPTLESRDIGVTPLTARTAHHVRSSINRSSVHLSHALAVLRVDSREKRVDRSRIIEAMIDREITRWSKAKVSFIIRKSPISARALWGWWREGAGEEGEGEQKNHNHHT